jgi:hypothetical protein
VPFHQSDQLFDMSDRRILQDSVPEVEDVWTLGESVKGSPDRALQRVSAGEERQRIDIALDGEAPG